MYPRRCDCFANYNTSIKQTFAEVLYLLMYPADEETSIGPKPAAAVAVGWVMLSDGGKRALHPLAKENEARCKIW